MIHTALRTFLSTYHILHCGLGSRGWGEGHRDFLLQKKSKIQIEKYTPKELLVVEFILVSINIIFEHFYSVKNITLNKGTSNSYITK